jgi:hypothetical protein
MKKQQVLGPNGKVTTIETDWFQIAGQDLKIAELAFDPYTMEAECFGYDNQGTFKLPPHLMLQLGEALIEGAHAEFERLESKFRKDADNLIAKANEVEVTTSKIARLK